MAKSWVRRAGTALAALVVLLVLAVGMVYALSERKLRRQYPVPESSLVARTDSAGIARGRHLYHSITCALCHAADGGGSLYVESPLGVMAGPNLTRGRGGLAQDRSDADWVRAVRHGVRNDGTSLILMPSEVFVHLSDGDLGALLGYVRQLPPVDRDIPRSRFRLLGRALLAAGKLSILVAPKTPPFSPPSDAEPDSSAAYGRYLASISGCHGCHGYGLSGGVVAGPPGLPPASNLTPSGIGSWTESDFRTALREGRRPAGTELHEFMPWREFRNMSDQDLAALWAYLRGVPPKPFGGK